MTEWIPFISDALLLVAALGAAVYCLILSRRLARLSSIDKGLGGAIAVLSVQVDEMSAALDTARQGSDAAAKRLEGLMRQAEALSNGLELTLAACHDLDTGVTRAPDTGTTPAREGAAGRSGPEPLVLTHPVAAETEESSEPPAGNAAGAVPRFGRHRPEVPATAAADDQGAATGPVFRRRPPRMEAAE